MKKITFLMCILIMTIFVSGITCNELEERSRALGEQMGQFLEGNVDYSEVFDKYDNATEIDLNELENLNENFADSLSQEENFEKKKSFAALEAEIDLEQNYIYSKADELNCEITDISKESEKAMYEQLCGIDNRGLMDEEGRCDVIGTGSFVAKWDILRLSKILNLSQSETLIGYAIILLVLYFYIFRR